MASAGGACTHHSRPRVSAAVWRDRGCPACVTPGAGLGPDLTWGCQRGVGVSGGWPPGPWARRLWRTLQAGRSSGSPRERPGRARWLCKPDAPSMGRGASKPPPRPGEFFSAGLCPPLCGLDVRRRAEPFYGLQLCLTLFLSSPDQIQSPLSGCAHPPLQLNLREPP